MAATSLTSQYAQASNKESPKLRKRLYPCARWTSSMRKVDVARSRPLAAADRHAVDILVHSTTALLSGKSRLKLH